MPKPWTVVFVLLAALGFLAFGHFGSRFCCAAVFLAGLLWLRRLRPRSALLELAEGIRGDGPAALVARSKRIAELKAAARPPPTQEEELAMLDTSPSPRFLLDDPAWLNHLNAEGFAVLANVVSEEQLGQACCLLWDFLEANSGPAPWRRSSPETWTDEALRNIGCPLRGLVNGAGMGQSDFLWFLRTLPRVRQVFEKIWGTQELLVSFDCAGIFRPWHHGFKKTVSGWWHVDQGAAKQGRHAVQGFVSLYPADGSTGGLTVVPKSHLRFAEVVKDQQNPREDYFTVQPYCPVLQSLPRRLVCCQAGDLVLWDSRTIHANSPAKEQPTAPADRLLRAVAYICMTPKRFAPKDVLLARKTAYEHRFSTSHWPHQLDLGTGAELEPRSFSLAPAEVQALVC